MKKLIVLVFLGSFGLTVFGQENLNEEVIDVVKNFRPKIMQAHKIKTQPQFIDTTKVSENLKYVIRFEDFKLNLNTDSLAARILKRTPTNELYSKHIELGLGTLVNPHLAIDFSNGKSTKNIYQAYLNYDGAFSEKQDFEDQFSYLNFGGAYKRVFNALLFESDLLVKDNYRFDYEDSFFRNSSIDFKSTVQLIDTFSVFVPQNMKISSQTFFRDSEFVESKIALSSKHSTHSNQDVNWVLLNNLAFQQSDNLNTIHWESALSSTRSFERTLLSVGVKSDVLNNDFKIFPEARIQYELIKRSLFAYSEVGGNRLLYTLNTIYTTNPFSHESSIITSNSMPANINYFGRIGLNGILFKGMSYQVSMEGITQDGFVHFLQATLPDTESNRSLVPQFTSVNSVKLNVQLDAKFTDKFQLWFKGAYQSFDKVLSYVPELKLGLYGDYHYNEQWFINGSIRYTGAREYLVLENEYSASEGVENEIVPFVNVNLKLNFAYNNQLGFYIEGVNLLNNTIDFWQHDLVLGSRLNFGFKYRF